MAKPTLRDAMPKKGKPNPKKKLRKPKPIGGPPKVTYG